MFKDKDFSDNELYEKRLYDKFSTNLGYLYENVMAQTPAATDWQQKIGYIYSVFWSRK